MEGILKIVKSLENSDDEDEEKEQRGGFLSMLLGTLGASLLGKMLLGKGVIRAGEGTAKKSSLKNFFLIPPNLLTNFEIEMYYKNEPRFNGVFSRDNLSERSSSDKIKDRAYVINLDEYFSIGTHWVAFYVNNKTATYFDSYAFEHIPKEIKKFITIIKV